MELDIDPFEIPSWNQYAIDCAAANETWRFRKALSDYIYITNQPCYKEIREYVNRRRGEWASDEIVQKLRRIREFKELERQKKAAGHDRTEEIP